MPGTDRDDAMRTRQAAEPRRQRKPREGVAGRVHTWTVTFGICAILLTIMYGITTHRAAEHAEQERQANAQYAAGAMQQGHAPPNGRLAANTPAGR